MDPADALPPMTAYYVMRVGRTAIVPLLSSRRSGGCAMRSVPSLENTAPFSSPIMGRSSPRKDLESAIYATEELEETAKLYLLLRGINPRILSSGPGRRSRDPFQT